MLLYSILTKLFRRQSKLNEDNLKERNKEKIKR